MAKEEIHKGHRERLKEKFLTYPEAINQHELIELLLFYSIPRVDTNVTAHNLCSTFGKLENLFSKDVEELTAVEGIGKSSAILIKIVGELLSRLKLAEKTNKEYYSFNDYKDEIIKCFSGLKNTEKCMAVFFDKKHKWIAQTEYNCNLEHEVDIDITAYSKAIARYSPHFVILAHNHTSGNVTPSKHDDIATDQVNLVSSIHGVKMLDHIIFSGEKYYSYYQDDRLRENFSEQEINDIIKSVKRQKEIYDE